MTAGVLNVRDRRMEEADRYFARAVALDEAGVGPAGMLISTRQALGD
ncbi:MAG: hypothetical protein ACYC8V_00820 [Caulobacteraceae bacterium]